MKKMNLLLFFLLLSLLGKTQNNLPLRLSQYIFNEATQNWESTTRTNYEYNYQGQLLKEYDERAPNWQPAQYYHSYAYNSAGNLIYRLYLNADYETGNYDTSKVSQFKYNQNQDLLEQLDYIPFFENYKSFHRTNYSYNEQGCLASKQFYYFQEEVPSLNYEYADTWKLQFEESYEYDDNCLLSVQELISDDGFAYQRYEHGYDQYGHLAERRVLRTNDQGNWRLNYIEYFENDPAGNVLFTETMSFDNEMDTLFWNRTFFEYEDPNLDFTFMRREYYVDSLKSWRLGGKEEFEISPIGERLRKIWLLEFESGGQIFRLNQFFKNNFDDNGFLIETREIRQDFIDNGLFRSIKNIITYERRCDGTLVSETRVNTQNVSPQNPTSSTNRPFKREYIYNAPANCETQINPGLSYTIFPNPSANFIYIEGDILLNGRNDLKLFNAQGQCVLQQQIPISLRPAISVSKFSPGIYFLEISNPDFDQVFQSKLMIN